MALIIQERDIKIFRFINSMRNGDSDIISCYYFSSRSAARRRFNLLVKNGYLIKGETLSPLGFNRYTLSRQAYNCMRSHYFDIHLPKHYVGLSTFDSEHDRMVAISRLYLVKNNICFGYRSEREIMSELSVKSGSFKRSLLPDGLFFDQDKNHVNLEYELAIKTRKQLDAKLENHIALNKNKKNSSSLFIIKSPRVINYIKSKNIKFIKILNSKEIEEWYLKKTII